MSLPVVRPLAGGDELAGAYKLYRQHSRTLGNMPRGAFAEALAREHILGAFDEDELIGYCLFSLPYQEVSIAHLCVATAQRGRGVARLLVDALSEAHKARTGVRAVCRNDYDLAGQWLALGFVAGGRRVGRGGDSAELTVWWKDHDNLNLFSHDRPSMIASLDHNIIIDFVTKRSAYREQSVVLEQEWLREHVRLGVTRQVHAEIQKLPGEQQRRYQTQLTALDALPVNATEFSRVLAEIEAMDAAAAVQHTDRVQAAEAIAAGAELFITRDARLISDLGGVLGERYGLSVIAPLELSVHLEQRSSPNRYWPETMAGTAVSSQRTPAGAAAEATALINNADGETRAHLSALLRAIMSPEVERRTIRDRSGALLAQLAWRVEPGRVECLVLRVVRHHLDETLARQLLWRLRLVAAGAGAGVLDVVDPHPSPQVVKAMLSGGFARAQGTWRAPVRDGCTDLADLDVEMAATATSELTDGLIATENTISPGLVTGTGALNYLVPIKPQFADRLLDTGLTLDERDEFLGLSVENVYYRSARMILKSPGHIIWYASRDVGRVISSAVAVSRLIEVRNDSPRRLFQSFKHFGVWTRQQITDAGDGTLSQALRFVDTRAFVRPVALSSIQEICAKPNWRIQSPVAITDAQLREITLRGLAR